jgi:drug/metabolite transporter (DMT)-like permease
MDFLPIISGLLAALSWGMSDYFITKPTRALGQYKTTAYAMLFSTLILLPFLLYTGVNTDISPEILFLALLSGVVAFLGFFLA